MIEVKRVMVVLVYFEVTVTVLDTTGGVMVIVPDAIFTVDIVIGGRVV